MLTLRWVLPLGEISRVWRFYQNVLLLYSDRLSFTYPVTSLVPKSPPDTHTHTHPSLLQFMLFLFWGPRVSSFSLSNCLCQECAIFTLVAFQGCVNLSHRLAQDQQQGYFLVSLFKMIDLTENFLSSAWEEDHLADLWLWLITLEVSLKDLSAWHVISSSKCILHDMCTLSLTWNINCLTALVNVLHYTNYCCSIYRLVIVLYLQCFWQSKWCGVISLLF